MTEFHFANANWWQAAWWLAAVVAILVWIDWRRSEILSRFISTAMQARLACRLSPSRRWLSLVFLALAGASLVFALMRPQLGLTFVETPRAGAQIMVCLDVSKSMLAEDTAPNRLERAKAEISDLLSYLRGDQVGLIAFAGRAAVLCPLTPDYGFLKLILDSTGPSSVGRGGTSLEEPIRKAVAGFRTSSDVSRVLMLITDGEDHDSHPLDAAKSAAERGIKILTIGFGDESGSEIFVTDPRTGAKTQVLDADGKSVITRLDGQTLREIALATDGAYIPAGTGALDLKSIYDAHIVPLVRGKSDGQGHAIRQDVFQWAVLASLVFLVISIILRSGSVRKELGIPVPMSKRPILRRVKPSTRRTSSITASMVLSGFVSSGASGQPPVASQSSSNALKVASNAPNQSGSDAAKSPSSGTDQAAVQPIDPRAAYNEAVDILSSDCDQAERLLTDARREAGTDGDVRFRATYNLGIVQVERADRLLKDKPEEALKHLRQASDWFRDAARLRPEDQDSRHNLEVVLRRIVELADSLAKKDGRDLAQQLDEAIDAQRNLIAATRQLVDRIATNLGSPSESAESSEEFRSDFRQLSMDQRQIVSDIQAITSNAREELDRIKAKTDKDRSPEENVRVAQLSNLIHYTSQADQRFGQAHSQMRRRQGERSFRRAANGLSELKRARDQLRNPVELLDVIISDVSSDAQLIALASISKSAEAAIRRDNQPMEPSDEAGKTDSAQRPARPAWLTREHLEENAESVAGRLSELNSNLQAALQQPDTPADDSTKSKGDAAHQQQELQKEKFLALLRQATPHLTQGHEKLMVSKQSLASSDFDRATQSHLGAIDELQRAREVFFDLQRLVELAYQRESLVQKFIAAEAAVTANSRHAPDEDKPESKDSTEQSDKTSKPAAETIVPEINNQQIELAARMHKENVVRVERIAKLVDEALAEIPTPSPAGPTSPQGKSATGTQQPAVADNNAEQIDAARQKLSLAKQLVQHIGEAMQSASEPLNSAQDRNQEPLTLARQHVATSVERLQDLRRLFFSIVQHLQETAQRQSQLNDETEQSAGIQPDSTTEPKTGQFQQRQSDLSEIAKQIAQVLTEQGAAVSQPAAAANPNSAGDADSAQSKEHQAAMAEKFSKASKLVGEGQESMQQASNQLAEVVEKVGKSADSKPAPNATPAVPDASTDKPADSSAPVSVTTTNQPSKSLFADARKSQDAALEKLLEALAVLQPPDQQQPNQDQQQQDDQQSEQQQEQSQAGQNQPQKPDEQKADGGDPSRLLQAVRDREAQRRRDREKRAATGQASVEKDW